MTSAEWAERIVRRLNRGAAKPLVNGVFRGLQFLDGLQIAWSRPKWQVPAGREKDAIYQGPGPLVIGGTGGSGTRVLARAVRDAGCYLGDTVNIAHDCMAFTGMWGRPFNPEILKGLSGWMLRPDELHAAISRYGQRETRRFSPAEKSALVDDILRRVAWLLRNRPTPDTPWGWKFPSSILLLPILDEIFPAMRFIHLVRDGRDMAFSSNQVALRGHGKAFLESESEGLPGPVRAAMLWNRMNMDAVSYGRAAMGERYLVVRFEDLCADPVRELSKIWTFMGFDAALSPEEAARSVAYGGKLGRWRTRADQELLRAVSASAEPGLRTFGYWPTPALSDTMPPR